MASGTSLKADDLIRSLRDHFGRVADHRDPLRTEIFMTDILTSGYAIYSLKINKCYFCDVCRQNVDKFAGV